MTQPIFHYHPQTREFLGQSEAKPHPKREGEFLIPAFATEIPLPETSLSEGHKWQFGNDAWNEVEDHRGEEVYSTDTGKKVDIQDLGPLPENVTPLAQATPEDTWDGAGWQTPDPAIPTADDVRQEARKRLYPTDWYVTRFAETGEVVPTAISNYRTAVRAASNIMEASLPTDFRDDSNWPVPVA
jgi:hypothetical protein